MLRAFLLLPLMVSTSPSADAYQSAPAQPSRDLAEGPRGNLTGIVNEDDYPADAMEKGEQGTVTVRLSINERGEISGCEVEISSGSPSLDAQTCTIVSARAKFEPAKDSIGRPVVSEVRQRITWKLEETLEATAATSPELARIAAELPKASTPAVLLNAVEVARAMDYPREALRQEMQGRSHVRLLVDRDGQAARCWVIESSGHDVLDAQTCDLYVANAKFRPARDPRGNPVASLTDQRLTWRLEGGPVKIPANVIARITAVVGPEGELRSCKGEMFLEGSWREGPPEMCEDFRNSDPNMRRAMREKSKLHDAVVAIEIRALTEAGETMPDVGRGPGEVLVALRSARMKFAPDGTRLSCLRLESIGLEGRDDICSGPSDNALKPPKEMLGKAGVDMRYLSAIYLTGEPEFLTEQ